MHVRKKTSTRSPRAQGARKYRKLPVKVKAHTGDFESLRQVYSLPVDTCARNELFAYIARHAYMKSFLIAVADEMLLQFAQCHNEPVIKLDLLDGARLTVTIDAEVMSEEADVRLNAVRDWADTAITNMSSVYIDIE